ncbi:MAG: hypothetical protein ACO2YL_04230 [Paracoccaceae bacterium]
MASTQLPEGVSRTWGWLCDPTHPETGLIVRVGDNVVGFLSIIACNPVQCAEPKSCTLMTYS